jgi:hypothetical protein
MPQPRLSNLPRFLVTYSLLIAALGCDELSSNLDDYLPSEANEDAARAADSTDLGSLEAALLAATTEMVDLDATEEQMATEAAEAVDAVLEPAGCVEAVVAGATVTFTLNDCSGPYGLGGVSGVANLAFTVAGLGSVSVSLTAANIEVNNATLGVNVSGGLSANDDGNLVYELISTGGGTTADGLIVTRTGEFGMVLEGGCMTLNGGWTTTIGESAWATTITNFERCDATCPSSGTIVWGGAELEGTDAPEGRGVTVTFDGDDTAAWATTGLDFGQTELACGMDG